MTNTTWTTEGLWNGIVGPERTPDTVRTEATEAGQTVEQWLTEAVAEAREQGLDDSRDDAEIVELLAKQFD